MSVATSELRVTMNTDMVASKVCLQAACGESGICYSGARWVSPRELSIVPDRPLLPKHRYQIGLGQDGKCLMASLNGQALAPVTWEFETE